MTEHEAGERSQCMILGVVVEQRKLNNPWQEFEWRPVAVVPGAEPVDDWKVLNKGEGWTQFLVASLPLELHRKETEGYKVNLANTVPVVYVVLKPLEEIDAIYDIAAFKVTASPYEAQDYLDSGEIIVEGVPMPDGVMGWIKDFCERHHVDEPFIKRKRKEIDPNDSGFSRRPDGPKRGRRLN